MSTRKWTVVFEQAPNWFFGVGAASVFGFIFVLRLGPWAFKITKELKDE